MSFSIIPKRLPILYSIFFHVNNPVPETLFFCRIHKFTQQKSPPGELRRGHSNNEQPAKGLTTGHVDVAIWKFKNHKAPEDVKTWKQLPGG